MTSKNPPFKFSKNDIRYWEARVYHPIYGERGNSKESATFAVRIQAHGGRRNVALRETTKRDEFLHPGR
jgi:hypothetical protein